MRIVPRLSAHENYVASILTLAMILPPALLLAVAVIAGGLRDPWIIEAAQVAVAVLAALVVGALLRRSEKIRAGVTWRAYGRAFLLLATINLVRGVFEALTGRTATKMGSFAIPRSASVGEFALAVAFALLAAVCGVLGERPRA